MTIWGLTRPIRQANSSPPISAAIPAMRIVPPRVIGRPSFGRHGVERRIAEGLHRFPAQALPQAAGYLAEHRFGDDAAVALARPAGGDDVDEAARPRRHRAE